MAAAGISVAAGTLRLEHDYTEVNVPGRLTAYLNGEPISKERAGELLSQAQREAGSGA